MLPGRRCERAAGRAAGGRPSARSAVSISALVTPALMGGRKVRMLGNLVYDEVLTSMNWPFAATIAVILLVFTGLVMTLYLRTMRGLARRSGLA